MSRRTAERFLAHPMSPNVVTSAVVYYAHSCMKFRQDPPIKVFSTPKEVCTVVRDDNDAWKAKRRERNMGINSSGQASSDTAHRALPQMAFTGNRDFIRHPWRLRQFDGRLFASCALIREITFLFFFVCSAILDLLNRGGLFTIYM